MGQDIDDKLMDMFGDSEQLKIFETKVIKDLIFFKWSRYAKIIHYMAGFVHLIYGITFCVYTSEIYLENEYQNKAAWLWLMSICISCAFVYDFTQFYQSGTDYFLDKWNYVDQLHIWVGYLNVYFQYSFEDDEGPRNPHCQLSMIFCTIFMLIKTFFYLRIFGNMTALVIMMKYVISDLRVFIFFYLIQLIIFSIILGVLYVGNYDDPEDGNVAKYYKTLINTATGYKFNDYPGYEYKHISLFSANIMRTLRFSLGDYDFSAINHLNVFESTVFWITWVFTIMMTCIVFLNFIIAEVSQSYQKV